MSAVLAIPHRIDGIVGNRARTISISALSIAVEAGTSRERISVSDQDTSRDPAWDTQFEVPAKEDYFRTITGQRVA